MQPLHLSYKLFLNENERREKMEIAVANVKTLEIISQWVSSVAHSPENHNLEAWLTEAENVASDTPENADIVIEMRGFATSSGRPETLTLKIGRAHV